MSTYKQLHNKATKSLTRSLKQAFGRLMLLVRTLNVEKITYTSPNVPSARTAVSVQPSSPVPAIPSRRDRMLSEYVALAAIEWRKAGKPLESLPLSQLLNDYLGNPLLAQNALS